MSGMDDGDKAGLRRGLRAGVLGLSAAQRAAESERLRRRLLEQPIWARARRILLYAPMVDEPDVWPLLEEALAQGREVALPRFVEGSGVYEACRVADPVRGVRLGRYGLREPVAGAARVDAKQLDLLLVPGIGFTLDGGRLGRGQGYYDRFLAGVPGFKCGVAFDNQIVPKLPIEPHDVCLDCILTPSRWHPTGRGAEF